MASLLAGARLVLRQGLRFLPAYRVRPAAVAVRCLSSSARCLTTAVQDVGTINTEPTESRAYQSRFGGWIEQNLGLRMKQSPLMSKQKFMKVFTNLCSKGTTPDSQALFLLQTSGTSLFGVSEVERITLVHQVWNKLKELGVVFNEVYYNTLLKIYVDHEHKFSPTDFLAGMEAAGVLPNQLTYERLIAAYCNDGDIEGASKVLGFLKSKNMPITEGVFSSLVKGHARAGDMESANSILAVMQEAGLAPRSATYAELLCAYAEKGDIESIKKTLLDCEHIVMDQVCVKVIYSLVRAGHCQFVQEVLELMPHYTASASELTCLCLNLLAQGYEDTALLVAKRFLFTNPSDDFFNQPGGILVRLCVELNMPLDNMKKFFSELKDSNLHQSPLQFALKCALEEEKNDLALELMKAMQEEELPVRRHYFFPMLAACNNNNDLKGSLEVLQAMEEMKVYSDTDVFANFFANLFKNADSFQSVMQENNFHTKFNELYLSVLRRGIANGYLKSVCYLLSSEIPLVKDGSLVRVFRKIFFEYKDFPRLAKITKLLCLDDLNFENPSAETDSVGYFLYGLIANMSDLEAQTGEEHLKQYFHQLKEMEVKLQTNSAGKIIRLLRSRNVAGLTEVVSALVSEDDLNERISQLEEQLENEKANSLPVEQTLNKLLLNLFQKPDLEKVLKLTLKYGSDYSFPMYLKVLGFFCKENDPIKAMKIKEMLDQREFSSVPLTQKYLQLFKVLALNGHIEDAINILKEMQEKNVADNKDSQNAFANTLFTLAREGDVNGVKRLHEHLLMLGLAKPTNRLCDSLVEVHLSRNDLSAALDAMIDCHKKFKYNRTHSLILKLVENQETDLLKKAVDYLYNTFGERIMLHALLFAFLESGNYQEAQKIAETPGLRAIPGIINFFTEKFKKENKVEVLEKCEEITRGVFAIDRKEMYHQLLSLYDENNDWAKSVTLWHNMKANGVIVQKKTGDLFKQLFSKNDLDILAYIPEFASDQEDDASAKILALCNDGKFTEASNLFLEAVHAKKSVIITAYKTLLQGLLKADNLDDALKLEQVARRHFRHYSLRNVSCDLLLAEQVRRDCLKEALVTLKSMLDNDSMPQPNTLRRLSLSFAEKGDLASLEEMEALTKGSDLKLPEIDTHYTSCKILAHLVNANFDEGTSMLESLYIEDSRNKTSFNLIWTVMKANMSEALEKINVVAEKLANQFSNYRLVVDLFTQSINANKVDEAKQLLQRCKGIAEQRELFERQIKKRCFRGQEGYVHRLIQLLAEYDPFYKEIGYNTLLKRSVYKKNVDRALELYERMKGEEIECDETILKELAVLLRQADRPVPFPEPQDSVQSSSNEQSYSSSPSEDKH